MAFCGNCGKKASDEDKFCTSCGTQIKEVTIQVTEEIGEILKEEYRSQISDSSTESQDHDVDDNFIPQNTRELGNKLEEMVQKIFQNQGYETKTRQKMLGDSSGVYNEIDVLATRKSVRIAIECKNYSEDRKVGVKEIRDFVSKLEDLNIHRGIFVTSSYFSEDARNWADSNPNEKQIELWDKEDLTHQIMTITLGRDSKSTMLGKTIKIENALPMEGSVDDYSILHLKNQDKVTLKRRDVMFIPIYVVSFNLHEEFRAPDKQMYSHHNDGFYYLDGTSGRFLYKKDHNEEHEYDLSREEKQIKDDLQDYEPRMLEVTEENNSRIEKIISGIDRKNVEFQVRNQVAKDNKRIIPWQQKVGRDKIETRQFVHMPQHSSIQCQTRIVYVPRLEIEFESKEYVYEKVVMMASGVVITDEISDCKHALGRKTTFAVCDTCGVSKCEKDITIGNNDDCYCKKHIPDDVKERVKQGSLTEKLKRKFF